MKWVKALIGISAFLLIICADLIYVINDRKPIQINTELGKKALDMAIEELINLILNFNL